ncbi:MAG: apolipoprotein N-acyltransferase, partial [Acidimicrobiales bacterium]
MTDAAGAPTRAPVPARSESPKGMGDAARTVGIAALAGLLLAAALPPWGWWPLAFVGVAVLERLIDDQPAWSRVRRGFLVGVALLGPTYSWMAAFTPPGYVLAVLFYAAMLGAALVVVPRTSQWRLAALPGALVLWDAVRGRWPFGGVPISGLAVGQVDSPLVGIARVGGPLLLGLAVGALGVGLAALARRSLRAVAAAGAVVAVLLALAAIAPRAHDGGTLRVGIVQGGGQQGTSVSDVLPSVVFRRHLDAAAALPTGLDMVLLPEDVAEVDGPFDQSRDGAEVAALARRLHAVVLVGAIEDAGPTRFHNVQMAFGADGSFLDRYEKVRRVPFGEFTPLRALLEAVGGGAVRASDALPGADPATLSTPVGTFGVSTSWEIFFADRARAAVRDGGEVLLNPTNGASFHGSIVQSQQLALTRLRAIETDRWAMQAAPTGYSAIVTPSGRVVTRSSIGERGVLTGDVTRRAGLTWAVRFGDWPAVALALLGTVVAWTCPSRGNGWRIAPPTASSSSKQGDGSP